MLTGPRDVVGRTTCVETDVHGNPNDDGKSAGNEQHPTEEACHSGKLVHARRSLNGSKPGIYETGGRQYAGRHADDEQDYRNGSEEGPHARPPNFYLSYAAAAT